MAPPRNPKRRTATPPEHPKRTSVSELAKMLAERRAAGSSSVTVKVSAQGVFMPEVTVVANEDDETIDRMVKQATDAYTTLLKAAQAGA